MNDIIITKVQVDNPSKMMTSLSGSLFPVKSGPESIQFSGFVYGKSTKDKIMREVSNSACNIKEIITDRGRLYDCYITGYDIKMTPSNSSLAMSIDGIAKRFEPFMDITFSDGITREIECKSYVEVRQEYGPIEDMTYDEFKQKCMVLDL